MCIKTEYSCISEAESTVYCILNIDADKFLQYDTIIIGVYLNADKPTDDIWWSPASV